MKRHNYICYLLIIFIVLLVVNLFLRYVCKYFEINAFEQVLGYVFINAIAIYCLSYFIAVIYFKKRKLIFDNSASTENILIKDKIIKPFIKEIDMCHITSETSYISNVLNIMRGLSICSILLVTTISYNIDESLNLISISVACIIYYSIIIFHILLDNYNEFCKSLFELDIKENTVIMRDSLDEKINRNSNKIKKIILFMIFLMIINSLSVFMY